MLHELGKLQQTAQEAYEEFTFNKGRSGAFGLVLTVSVLQGVASFASSTLSTFYFDVAKDTLYCDPVNGARRQAIIATQSHVSLTNLSGAQASR